MEENALSFYPWCKREEGMGLKCNRVNSVQKYWMGNGKYWNGKQVDNKQAEAILGEWHWQANLTSQQGQAHSILSWSGRQTNSFHEEPSNPAIHDLLWVYTLKSERTDIPLYLTATNHHTRHIIIRNWGLCICNCYKKFSWLPVAMTAAILLNTNNPSGIESWFIMYVYLCICLLHLTILCTGLCFGTQADSVAFNKSCDLCS